MVESSAYPKWLIIRDNSSKELICVAYMPENTKEASLVIYENVDNHTLKEISTLPLGSFPYFISENNHNVVVICETAVGYLIDVFGYKDGGIQQLLSDGSYLLPEFIYVGHEYQSAIMVPNIEWRKINNGEDEERLPVSANIYIWNGTDYDTYKEVPWSDRFNVSMFEER